MTPAVALEFPTKETKTAEFSDELLDKLKAQGQSPANIIRRIEALWWNENVDDYVFKPERHASRTAKTYIRAIYPFVDHELPEPEVDSDGLGGIELQWRFGTRTLILGCRAARSQKDFIYYQDGQHGIIEASPLNLKERLTWLIS